MQINVLPPSHPGAMTMMSFPEIAPQAREWISNQLQAATNVLTDVGRGFLNRATELHAAYNDGTIERSARKIARTVKTLLHPNTIVPLETIDRVQAAKPIMQRYIMAQPTLRELYHRQLCDGYSDTYVDFQAGIVGEEHYDYRRVMEHIVRVEKDEVTGDENIVITHYLEDLHEGDRLLTDEEKFTILDVWDVVDAALAAKIDPTDIFNGNIGG